MLKVGDKIPSISFPTDSDFFTLSDLKEESLIIFFYPKADTSGCTKEAIEFSQLIDEFHKLNAKVIGIFSRLALRDGKNQYLTNIPRCWELLERACLSSELVALNNWLKKIIPSSRSPMVDKIES